MLLILLSTVGLAMAGQSSTPGPAPATSQPGLHSRASLLHNLIVQWGYSDTCVATALEALEACNPIFSEQHQQQPSLIQEAEEVFRPLDCKDLLDSGDTGSGLRLVYPYPGQPHHNVTVLCDHTVDGGGWTVFQRRTNDSIRQDFYRTWNEYQLGFGDLETEFWMGLDLLHVLTSTTQHELWIDLADYEGGKRWAKYGFFTVGSDETKYLLNVGRYSGDAGDAMKLNHGESFSTHDQDNDIFGSGNCAEVWRGAWWYKDCGATNLNGYQHQGWSSAGNTEGIIWQNWHGLHYSLRRTSMMIRPAF